MDIQINNLKNLLTENYALYFKVQNYHWNITGSNFKSLHELLEDHYKDLAEAIDTLAELIRSLDVKVPADIFIKKTNNKLGNENFSAEEMLKDLIEDHIIFEKNLNNMLLDDEVINGFLTERMTFHRKAIWMLKSSL